MIKIMLYNSDLGDEEFFVFSIVEHRQADSLAGGNPFWWTSIYMSSKIISTAIE